MNPTELLRMLKNGDDIGSISQRNGLERAYISSMLLQLESLGLIERTGPNCEASCGSCPKLVKGDCAAENISYYRITDKGERRLHSDRTIKR